MKYTKPKLPNKTYQKKPNKPNLPNKTNPTKPIKPNVSNIPNQSYQTEPIKQNHPNKTYQIKHTKPRLPIHMYPTKTNKLNLGAFQQLRHLMTRVRGDKTRADTALSHGPPHPKYAYCCYKLSQCLADMFVPVYRLVQTCLFSSVR